MNRYRTSSIGKHFKSSLSFIAGGCINEDASTSSDAADVMLLLAVTVSSCWWYRVNHCSASCLSTLFSSITVCTTQLSPCFRFPSVRYGCRGHSSYVWSAMLRRNLREWWDKNPRSTDKYTKFGRLIIGKIIKIIATKCHIFRLKCTEFDSWHLSVCLFVRLRQRWSLTYTFIDRGFRLATFLPNFLHIQRPLSRHGH